MTMRQFDPKPQATVACTSQCFAMRLLWSKLSERMASLFVWDADRTSEHDSNKETIVLELQRIDDAVEKPAVQVQVTPVGVLQIRCKHGIREVQKTDACEPVEHVEVSMTKIMIIDVIQYDMSDPGEEQGHESDELTLLYAMDWTLPGPWQEHARHIALRVPDMAAKGEGCALEGPARTTPPREPCGPRHGGVQRYSLCEDPILPSDVAVAHGNINPERPAPPEEGRRTEFETHIIDLEIGGNVMPPRSVTIGYGCAGGGSKYNPDQQNVPIRVRGHPDDMITIRPNFRN